MPVLQLADPDHDSADPRRATIAALRSSLDAVRAERRSPADGQEPASAPGLGAIDSCFAAGALPMAAVHELWADTPRARPAAAGFALALARHLARAQRGPRAGGDHVWIYPRGQAQEWGLPYGPGLMAFGHDPGRFILVETRGTLEALWAGEEVLRARAPASVIVTPGEDYAGHAFTASRRFELAARAGLASALLLCEGAEIPASAASLRWRIAPVAEAGRGKSFPARPCWRIALERNRLGRCGSWTVEWNHELARLETVDADAGVVAAALAGRAGAGEIPLRRRRAGA